MYSLLFARYIYNVYFCSKIVNKVIQKKMIAKENHCKMIVKSPELLGELIKKINGNMLPDNIIRHLQRASKSIRSNVALIETLKEAGYTEDEIFETEKV